MPKKLETQDLPTSVADDPAVSQARVNLARVAEQRREVEDRVDMLERASIDVGGGDQLTAVAERVAAGAALADVRQDTARLVAEMASVEQDLAVVKAAERMAGEQLRAAVKAAEDRLLPLVRDRYAVVVGEIADTLIELKRLSLREQSIREQYMHFDVRFFPSRLRPMAVQYDNYRSAAWILDAVDHGLATAEQFNALLDMCPDIRSQFPRVE